MNPQFETYLHNYVRLGVRVGVNLQPGQSLVIQAPTTALELVRLAAKEAYAAGARYVHVEWNDDPLTRIRYEMAPEESFGDGPALRAHNYDRLIERDAAFLSLVSANPDLLTGIDPDRVQRATKAMRSAMSNFYDGVRTDKFSWSILAVPSEVWADKMFGHEPAEKRMGLLWDAIFQATRADRDDPVGAWTAHLKQLQEKSDYLNGKRYRALHYVAPGTDLVVELADDHLWVAGDSINEKGTMFVANMPTEEVFTAPKKDGVNGTVRSTKPLNYAGTLIEDFAFTFKDGKIVDFAAAKGGETLQRLLDTDEGARYLGEAALVPHRSPISDTGLIFYNTLFDENASNHLAIGSAYAFSVEGGKSMTKEQLAAKGLNDSLTHVDFMIGSADMSIDGIAADGSREPIFRGGNWAI
ncbi:aminopeptidase [Paenibacillus sp.]|uniref:aminopeptidase n=1 Tax=Paenibacillus sp. TaxID=58172 RepID=UPI002D6FFE71|nr:aminopeptidase [Paenibacillus sp.]HZG57099.1 aminopeptidase [Paenibacillus sp.]